MSDISLDQRLAALEARVEAIEEQLRLNPPRKAVFPWTDRRPLSPEELDAHEEVQRYIREAREAELADLDIQFGHPGNNPHGVKLMALDKNYLNLAGEYRVCAELLKRSLLATITYGNEKGVDIFAVGQRRKIAAIEVKASSSNRFVTKLFQNYPDPNALRHDFWVLCSIVENDGQFDERFFILMHDELAAIQAARNGHDGGFSYGDAAALAAGGVDNVLIGHVADHEDCWDKIIRFCQSPD